MGGRSTRIIQLETYNYHVRRKRGGEGRRQSLVPKFRCYCSCCCCCCGADRRASFSSKRTSTVYVEKVGEGNRHNLFPKFRCHYSCCCCGAYRRAAALREVSSFDTRALRRCLLHKYDKSGGTLGRRGRGEGSTRALGGAEVKELMSLGNVCECRPNQSFLPAKGSVMSYGCSA